MLGLTCKQRSMISGRQHLRQRPLTMYAAWHTKEPSPSEYQASSREISIVTPAWNRGSSPATENKWIFYSFTLDISQYLQLKTKLDSLPWKTMISKETQLQLRGGNQGIKYPTKYSNET